MKNVFEAAWEAFEEIRDKNENIVLQEDKRDEFVNECVSLYNKFIDVHMAKPTDEINKDNEKNKDGSSVVKQNLDRHKNAAIVSIIGSRGYIQSKNEISDDEFFIGRYTVPITVAIQIVLDDTNRDLVAAKLIDSENLLNKFYIPEPKVCATDYEVVLARTLYFEEEYNVDDLLRIIELANVFFLMEELTLLKANIPMDKWLKFKRSQSLNVF